MTSLDLINLKKIGMSIQVVFVKFVKKKKIMNLFHNPRAV